MRTNEEEEEGMEKVEEKVVDCTEEEAIHGKGGLGREDEKEG